MTSTHSLSPDTTAVLLLCSYWGKTDSSLLPLTNSEYNRFAEWLNSRDLRPADILENDFLVKYAESSIDGIPAERINDLVQRGGVLILLLEKWLNSGFWVVSRADENYPKRLRSNLKQKSPPLLYGIGDLELTNRTTIGIVGSRDVDVSGQKFAQDFANACARERITVVSGGARGVDNIAMNGALENRGVVIGVLANDLGRLAGDSAARIAIEDNRLLLFSPFHPEAHFEVGNAMARNKLIYALSDCVVVVSSDRNKGGTWAGVKENHQALSVPVFVIENERALGNQHIINAGWGLPFPSDAIHSPQILFDVKPVIKPTAIQLPLL